ncbi:MAG: hydroxyisourate hydrolase [Deltaproteobacteria bacterium]|nr:hydroxyisourate hydrolase [Kofleriaceae bacterium]
MIARIGRRAGSCVQNEKKRGRGFLHNSERLWLSEYNAVHPGEVGDAWRELGRGATDDDGRLRTLTPPGPVQPGRYRITFDTDAYFDATDSDGFFPVAEIQFVVTDGAAHYHVPLLLSPFGYSTYRGS